MLRIVCSFKTVGASTKKVSGDSGRYPSKIGGYSGISIRVSSNARAICGHKRCDSDLSPGFEKGVVVDQRTSNVTLRNIKF